MASRLNRLPIRWRLAAISGGLTLAILLLFSIVFGLLTIRELRSDFDQDLRATAEDLQQQLRPTVSGGLQLENATPELLRLLAAGDASFRVVDAGGHLLFQTPGAPNLGPPSDEIRDVGPYRVASRPFFGDLLDGPVAFVQYAKPRGDLNASIDQVRLFLVLGVLGGTALALLAGLAVARRAMAPIAGLTAAAKDVTRTRDPAVRLPKPEADDEVADLAHTLEEMLRALDAARGETEAMLERQREFVADASHELRTPLTSVLANLELLESDLRGEQAEIASSALRSSQRMRRLVADLLLLARADAGRRAPRRPTDLTRVAAAVTAELAPVAAGRELALHVEDGLVAEGSPDDLHRLLLNLVENALRHTPAGTRVSVSGRREGDSILLAVEDDGPGIPPELRPRVFERFVRGGGDAGPGSGLGLAIVRAVAESHGGSVEITEPAGGGTAFLVRLPAAAEIPAPAPVL